MVGVSAINPVRKTGQLLSRRARLVGRAYILADPCCVAFWLILGPGGEYSGKVECFRVAFFVWLRWWVVEFPRWVMVVLRVWCPRWLA